MPNAEKVERVEELKGRIDAADAILLTEYRGLTVSEISDLRRSLAEGGASFAVVKNTLMRRAAEERSMADLESMLQGPTAVAFVEGDAVAAAKKVVDSIKRFPALVLKGGFMDGRVLSADDAKALADLDSREVMLSKVAGMMKSEMSRAASMFQAAQSRFASLMQALAEKLPAEAAADEPSAAVADAAEATGAVEATGSDAPEDAAADTDTNEDTADAGSTEESTDAAAPAEGEE